MKAAAYYTSNSRLYSEKTSLDNFDLTEEDLDKELKNMPNKDSKDTDKA